VLLGGTLGYWVQTLDILGISYNGDTPIAGWFIMENSLIKWMLGGYPYGLETSKIGGYPHGCFNTKILSFWMIWGSPFQEPPHIV